MNFPAPRSRVSKGKIPTTRQADLTCLHSQPSQVSAAASLSGTARESPARSADSGRGIATKLSRADPALKENSVSTIVEEQGALSVNITSCTVFNKGSQAGLSVNQVVLPSQVHQRSLSLVDRVQEQICQWFIHIRTSKITEDVKEL